MSLGEGHRHSVGNKHVFESCASNKTCKVLVSMQHMLLRDVCVGVCTQHACVDHYQPDK